MTTLRAATPFLASYCEPALRVTSGSLQQIELIFVRDTRETGIKWLHIHSDDGFKIPFIHHLKSIYQSGTYSTSGECACVNYAEQYKLICVPSRLLSTMALFTQPISWPTTVIDLDVMTVSKLYQLFLNFMIQMSSKLFFQSNCPALKARPIDALHLYSYYAWAECVGCKISF